MKLHFLFLILVTMFIGFTPLAAQETTECEDGFRLFDHELLVTDPVCVPENPQRVVALDPFAYELLILNGTPPVGAIGYLEPVYRNNFPYLSEEVAAIEYVGFPPNVEAILALNPDLIIGSFLEEEIVAQLSAIAPTISYTTSGSGDWKRPLRMVGELLGLSELVDDLFTQYEARLADLRAVVENASQIEVSIVRVQPDRLMLNLVNSFPAVIVTDAGFGRPESQAYSETEAIERYGGAIGAFISVEEIQLADGDYIFAWSNQGSDEENADADANWATVQASPLWNALTAAQNGAAYRVKGHWLGWGIFAAHGIIDDLFTYIAGVDPAEVSPNPFLTGEPEASAARVFTDSLGRTVEIPADPQRIVILNDSNGGAQTLSLGVTPVGMTTRNGVLELADRYDLSNVTEVGDYNAPNLEAILALQPDLIIGPVFNGDPYLEPGQIEAYEAIAPLVLMETQGSVESVMAGFADLLNAEVEFEALRADYEARVAEVRALLPDNLDDITVSVIQMQDDGLINTFGRGWFSFGEVFEDIGFTSYPPNQAEGQAVETCCLDSQSLETIREFDGDIIFYYATSPANDYSGDPLFQQLRAVQAGQAFEWTDDWWGNSYDTLHNILDDLEVWFSSTTIDPNVVP